ncbi:hypothetical protein D1781_12320 [Amnibacterium setariae]|uniref:Uncharacterized protein n=1 Tax=Amnibacterium setariae TaxID=2306585 RepID=A0A3A1TXE0_9MICO|nr:hypothetical protein D1781_12320 [Amnibacterium setariae]
MAAVGVAGLAVEAGRVGLLLLVEGADLLVPAAAAVAALSAGVALLLHRRSAMWGGLLVLGGAAIWAGAGLLAPLLAGGTTGEYVPYRAAGDPVAWSLLWSTVVVPTLAAAGATFALLGAAAAMLRLVGRLTRAARGQG